ncbi:MAG: FkbM family methyltransferase [Acidobacteriaceae bacterium]
MFFNREFVREVGPWQWAWRTFLRQFTKRVLRRDNSIILPTGLKMTLPRASKFSSEAFITRCNVDWGSEELFAGFLDPRGAFLDIGANVGYYSLYMLPRVSCVHAFEPDSRAQPTLRKNLGLYQNAHVHGVAVADRSGHGTFIETSSSEVSHLSGSVDDFVPDLPVAPTDITTVDDFVRDHRLPVTGIKIDVEGADCAVIQGALQTLTSQSLLVLAESEPNAALFDLLPAGYSVYAFVKTAGAKRFSFREIVPDDPAQTKMLFLVPKRLHREFFQLACSA